MKPTQEDWALFWCGLLRPVIFGEIADGDVGRYLRSLTEKEFIFPDGRRGSPSLSTLKRKLRQYRNGKLKGLFRKRRSDRGKPR